MTSQRSFPRYFPKWRDWKEYLTSSKMKCARSLHYQQNTRPWPLTRHVTSWRWRNPRCITILSATTFLPPNEERTTFFSKTSLLAGWSLVVNLPSHYRRKKWMLKSCHPSNANRAGSEIDEPMVFSTFLILMTEQCHVTVIGRLCDVCTGEGKSIQTHLLLFRTYTTEPLIQWHSNVNTTNVALSVRMRHGSTNDNIISNPIIKQK